MLARLATVGSLLAALAACSSDPGSTLPTGGGHASGGAGPAGGAGQGGGLGGSFETSGSGGGSAGGGGGACDGMLAGVIRDFSESHPDFEAELGTDKGIVETDLGADGKPVYAGDTPTTHGKEAFEQWYRNVDGVNVPIPLSISLTESSPGVFTFDDDAFFPIDGMGFGNEGNSHNYHFTYEIHAEFTYEGGEVFTFTGDDDLFAFINGKLAIDLGGVHGPQSQTIDLDAQAGALGIEPGKVYDLAFFFAERHTVESNFRIDTSISCFTETPIPE